MIRIQATLSLPRMRQITKTPESEADDQPGSDTSEETILLDNLPAEDSLTRELPA